MNKQTNPIPVGSFDTVTKGTKRIHKSTDSWWLKKPVLIAFIAFFSTLDGVTLYPAFECEFALSPLILYITTFGTALAINFIPCIAARFFLRGKYHIQEKGYTAFYLTLGFFALIFIGLAWLRIDTAQEVIGNLSNYMSSSAGAMAEENAPVSGAAPMVAVQILTNLLTSAIAFWLSYLSENPLKMKIEAMELQIADLEKREISLKCSKKELDMYDFEKVKIHEKQKCILTHESLESRKELLFIEADKALQMLLGSASACTVITDDQKAEDAARIKQKFVKMEPVEKNKLSEEVA